MVYADILRQQNPWWQGTNYSVLTGQTRPHYLEQMIRHAEIPEVTTLVGVRRSGKSTLFFQTIDHLLQQQVTPAQICHINLFENFPVEAFEDGQLLTRAFSEYKTLKNPQGKIYLFLDEVQELRGWERFVVGLVERKENVKIFVTGSSAHLLSSEYATLLTGRHLDIKVFPLDFREYLLFLQLRLELDAKDRQSLFGKLFDQRQAMIHHLDNYLRTGGFPRVVLEGDEQLREQLCPQYFEDIFYRDIIRRQEIRKPKEAENFARYLSTNLSNRFSLRSMARGAALNPSSVRSYLSYFERANFIFPVGPFQFSLKSQLTGTEPQKIYLIDTGLANLSSVSAQRDLGRRAENVVFIHNMHSGNFVRGYYYQFQQEVDLVYQYGKRIRLVQTCYTDEIPEREFNSLLAASAQFTQATDGVVLTRDTFEDREVKGKIIHLVPLWLWLLADDSE